MDSNSGGTTGFLESIILSIIHQLPFFFLKGSISRQDELDWGAAGGPRSLQSCLKTEPIEFPLQIENNDFQFGEGGGVIIAISSMDPSHPSAELFDYTLVVDFFSFKIVGFFCSFLQNNSIFWKKHIKIYQTITNF